MQGSGAREATKKIDLSPEQAVNEKSENGGRPRCPLDTVIAAILYRLREGCSWRALSIFAPYSTIYGWWKIWCESGLWHRVFQEVCSKPAGRLWGIDSTCAKVHKHALCAGQTPRNQQIGKTRGGPNTKIHALVDAQGRPLKILLSAGTVHDSKLSRDLLEGCQDRVILADKAYDSDGFRQWLVEHDLGACIPPKANRIHPPKYHRGHYKKRHRVENCFQRLKEFRAVATRYEKLDDRYLGFVLLAAILTW